MGRYAQDLFVSLWVNRYAQNLYVRRWVGSVTDLCYFICSVVQKVLVVEAQEVYHQMK